MDTSKKYILMCEKAEEIQKLCQWDMNHDFFGYTKVDKILVKTIWLPRQDQLQEILDKPERWASSAFDMLCSIYDFSQDWCGGGSETMGLNHFGEYLEKFSSPEQVWLAFVMKEKYDKTWGGEKWIKGA